MLRFVFQSSICCVWKLCLPAYSCQTLCNPADGSLPAPLSMEFSRQECWSGFPFSSFILLLHSVPLSILDFFFKAYLFCLCWVLLAVSGLSQLQCWGFSVQWLLLFWSTGSREYGLPQLWLLDSRAQAQQLWSLGLIPLRHFPRRGLEPVHPTLAGTFLATVLPVNSSRLSFSS